MNVGSMEIEESQTEDVDWVNNWKQYFHQFTIDDVLIIPSWEDVQPEDEDKMIIHIDPGTAFGTGMHETTLTLHPSDKKIRNRRYRDSGCGMRKWYSWYAGIEVWCEAFQQVQTWIVCNRYDMRIWT